MTVLEATALADVVLIVEDDLVTTESYRSDLTEDGIPTEVAAGKDEAFDRLEEIRFRSFERMVVLLDLMFQPNDPSDGLSIMQYLREMPEFREGRIKVVVCTGLHDSHIVSQMRSLGASKVYQKGVDPAEALQQVRLQLGREVLSRSLLFEVVDVDLTAKEVEIRYTSEEGERLRAIFDLEFAPLEARVPGGSFYCNFYKQLRRNDQLSTRIEPRPVDRETDADLLIDLLRDDPEQSMEPKG